MWLARLTDAQRRALLGLAHNVVVSDGILDPNEEGMLSEFKAEMGFAADYALDYLPLEGIDAVFESRQSRLIVMINLLRLSYADGAFEVEEECLLKEVSRVFGLSEQEFQLLDNWVRRWLALQAEALDLMSG